MSGDETIHVCLVDDHQIVVEGLRLLIGTAGDIQCIFTASSGEEALKHLRSAPVHVALVDIEMPGMDGITCCRLIREQFSEVHVIALTMYRERSLIKRMIEAGADGYLLKNTGRDELLTAIRRVYAGKSHYGDEIAEIIVRGNAKERQGIRKSMLPSLSSREKQIVRLIMDERTTAEIAEQLNISFNTVETHRRNIMHKLNARNTAGIVRIVLEEHLLEDDTSGT